MSSSSNEQLRQTVMVTENLTRLVNNKREIEQFIPILLPGVEKVVNNASLPEVRELAGKALKVLKDAESEQTDGKFHGRITLEQAKNFYTENIPEEEQPTALLKDEKLANYLAIVLQVDAHVNDWKRLKEYLVMATSNENMLNWSFLMSDIYSTQNLMMTVSVMMVLLLLLMLIFRWHMVLVCC